MTGSGRQTPSPNEALRQQPETSPTEITDDYFRENPAQATAAIVENAVRRNLMAVEQARMNLEEKTRLQEWEKSHAKEIEELRPVMANIYLEDRELYDSMPARKATDNLLKRAKERHAFMKASEFYEQLTGLRS